MGKIRTAETKDKQRHNPLHKDISSSSGTLRQHPRSNSHKHDNLDEDLFLDAATTRKILQLAKEQQEEIDGETSQSLKFVEFPIDQQQSNSEGPSSEEEYSDFEDGLEISDGAVVDEQDMELFERYMNPGAQSINLADKILAKIQEKEMYSSSQGPGPALSESVSLPPKVIAAYEKIGQVLSTYTHGKLPKLFKVLPTLKNWEDVLYVTDPPNWSSHATYEATKLFVSNLQANEAQKFVRDVLLEKFRNCIEDSENHALDYHLYRALKKSLYKPGAFFKGFLLPLVDDHCSVREATIAASVLTKVSVPVLHSSVALTQLVRRDFLPAATVFIRVLIEKKYALPYQTLDELVFYFMRFRKAAQMEMGSSEEGDLPPLPVVWHKAFLAFAQRYKNDITDDQREFLLETVRQRYHHAIGPEIRRELLSGSPRVEANHVEASMETAF